MSEPLKPYPAYKPTDVPWLQAVPEHWEVHRSKWLFMFAKELNKDGSWTNALSLTLRGVVNNDPNNPEGLVPKDYRTYQRFRKGDLVFKLIDLENVRTSRVGLVHENGIMSGAYLRLRPRTNAFTPYFYQQYYSLYQRNIYNQLGAGVRAALGHTDLLEMPIAVPPPAEQHLIVRYLHALDTKVKRYIRTKRKLIAALQEQKQAIIQRAVTRGMDRNVKLKSSGVEWLGEVPEGWKLVRIKYLLREVDVRSVTGKETLLSLRMHHGIVPFSEHFSHPPQGATMIGFKVVQPGQVVINRMQAGNGLIFKSNLKGLVSPDYAVLDCSADVNVDFLTELFRSRKMRTKFRQESKGLGTGSSGFLRLYYDRLSAIHIALPPAELQSTILVTLDRELHGVHVAVQRIENEISLMNEFYTRLVSDVVTGAIDVREAARKLPALDQSMSGSEDQKMEEESLSMAEGGNEYGNAE